MPQGHSGQKPRQIKVPGLESILNNPEDKLFVVNFWATWCAPCVSEIPAFQKAADEYDPAKVKFIMISLDFPSQIEQELLPFLIKNSISLDVTVMTEMDYNSWIDKIDPSWSGDIPATLFFNNHDKTKYFRTGTISGSELKKIISSLIKT
jgi:thiol-disulfide isomerase/thioredoxin